MNAQVIAPGEKPRMDAETIAARIDRLPITGFHRRMLWIVSFVFFFDISDIFTFSYAAPALIHYWNISISQVALVTSAGFFGMFLGSIFGGMFSDSLGRKRALTTMAIVFSLFSLANALAPNFPILFVTRFLTGFGISSLTVVVMTYIAEMFPAAVRGRWQGWAMVIALAGIPITGWVARLVVPTGPNGWRFIFVWGALGVLFLLFANLLYESPRWLARRGQEAQADKILTQIEAEVSKEAGNLPAPAPVQRVEEARAPWTTIFEATYLKRTLTLWGIWIFQTLGFYGFQAWVPTLLVKHGITITASLTYITLINVGAVPGALVATWISDRIERKYSIAVVSFLIAVSGLLYGMTFQPVLIVTFGFLVGMLIQTFATLNYAYTPEQYPTDVRNVGTGFAYGMGRIANVANAFIVAAIFTHLGYVPVFVYIAGAWVVTGLVALIFGAKTTRRRLEVLNPVVVETH